MRDGGNQAIMFLQRFRPRRPWTLVSEGRRGGEKVSTFADSPAEHDAARATLAGAQLKGIGARVLVGELPEHMQGRLFSDEDIVATSALVVSITGQREQAEAIWKTIGLPSAIIHAGDRIAVVYALNSVVPIGTARAALDRLVAAFKPVDGRAAWLLPIPGTFRKGFGAAVRAVRHDPNLKYSIEQLMRGSSGPAAPTLAARKASDIKAERLNWLWQDRLPVGLTFLAGAGSAGKTTLALNFAAIITQGRMWPDGTAAPKGSALVIEAEDSVEQVTVPRLIAAGANLHRVVIVRQGDDMLTGEQLEAVSKGVDDLRLVVLSPIRRLIHDNGATNIEIRRRLEPINDWAVRRGLAALCIMHPKKDDKREDAGAIAGSGAYTELARMVWLASVDMTDEAQPNVRLKRRKVINLKTNNGIEGLGSLYRIETAFVGDGADAIKTSRIAFLGELDAGEAPDVAPGPAKLLSHPPRALPAPDGDDVPVFDSGSMASPGRSPCDLWLMDYLSGGPRATSEVYAAGQAAGHHVRTIRRAAKRLKISRHGKDNEGTHWALP